MKQELQFYKKCLGEVLFFQEKFSVAFEGKTYHLTNVIGPVVSYQKNAYKFLYEEDGKVKKRLIFRHNRKRDKYQPANTRDIDFKDKRGHRWEKSERDFDFADTLNFKPHGRIVETPDVICPHINSSNHTCEFCKLVWGVVKKKKPVTEGDTSINL
ncbi:MAG: hypothetical protein CMO44_02735 [Verrucomicrobiales bacterium]|nr:hypothetical protein [Verrucomicrobiales bacterium]